MSAPREARAGRRGRRPRTRGSAPPIHLALPLGEVGEIHVGAATCNRSIVAGARGIRPVCFGVVAGDDYALPVPAQAGSYISRAITQGESATTAIRLVGRRAVEEQIAVQRYLACRELDIYRFAELLRADYSLVEYVGVVILAEGIRQVAQAVGAGDVSHAGVLDGGVVDCEPGGDGLRWGRSAERR